MTAEQIYKLKNEYLTEWLGEPLDPIAFYKEIFPPENIEEKNNLNDHKANPIISLKKNDYVKKNTGKKAVSFKNEIVFKDFSGFEKAMGNEFALCSMCSFFGRKKNAKHAYKLHGYCIDLDGVKIKQLRALRLSLERDFMPRPTYIANSGHGLHLYFLFYTPCPLYPSLIPQLQAMKVGLTYTMWNDYTSDEKGTRQIQGIYQGFRMVGSCSKLGRTPRTKQNYLVKVWRCGKPVDLAYLNQYVELPFQFPKDIDYWASSIQSEQHLTLDEAREKYPDWYERRIVKKLPPNQFVCNRGLYEWWKKVILRKGFEVDGSPFGAIKGNRYWCIAYLFVFAIKCNIEFNEVYDDALALMPILNERQDEDPDKYDEFTEYDIESASRFYDRKYAKHTVNAMRIRTNIQDIRHGKSRRNGRPQAEHLARARLVRTLATYDNNGRKPKADIVRQWRAKHPNGSKVQCKADTGLTYPTIRKWW